MSEISPLLINTSLITISITLCGFFDFKFKAIDKLLDGCSFADVLWKELKDHDEVWSPM